MPYSLWLEALEKGLAEPHGLGQSVQNHLNEVLVQTFRFQLM